MMQRINRLPARIRLSAAHSFRTPHFTLKVAPNEFSRNRFGFVISKKAAKLAVDRNRTKRKIRSCVEKQLPFLSQGFDFLFLIHTVLDEKDRQTMCDEVQTVLKKGNYFV